MIVEMSRVRICGPSARLAEVLAFAQREGVLHLVEPGVPPEAASVAGEPKAARHWRRMLADVDAAIAALSPRASSGASVVPGAATREARFARRTRRHAERLQAELAALDDERAVLLRYRDFFAAFAPLWGRELRWPDGHAFYVVMREGAVDQVSKLRLELTKLVGTEVELITRQLPSKEHAVLILVPVTAAQTVARLLSDSRVQELPAPPNLGQPNLVRSMGALQARLDELPARRAALEAERERLAQQAGPRLRGLAAWLHDELLVLGARQKARVGQHLFVLEGFLPAAKAGAFAAHAAQVVGPEIVVEALSSEAWEGEAVPVVMQNPPLFRPFELLTRRLPLPRYGTIDPTPFVAVFFPVFFGLIVGDVGYGAALALLALVLKLKSKPGTTLRSVSAIAAVCAGFSIAFGVLFGELFGTLGHAAGMRPLWFDREHAIIPFLGLSVALGVAHVTLGLVLAAVTSWRRGHPREAFGRSVAAVMVLLVVTSLLAAFELLPARLFTPAVIAVLVAFPALIALEGVAAVIELMSTFGHILSYARIMALGTASLMLAVVANQLAGALGSVVIGVVFALLFHLVNFGIGLFSPSLHAMRLHYVEFFGKFFSPGGVEYRPLAHWTPQHDP